MQYLFSRVRRDTLSNSEKNMKLTVIWHSSEKIHQSRQGCKLIAKL